MMNRLPVILCCILLSNLLHAQVITQISSTWDNRIDEWIIYTDDEDIQGLIELRWPLKNDLTDWRYELGELSGTIKQTWKGNTNSWEILPFNDSRITIKTVWKNDFSEWKVIQGSKTYRFKSKYNSQRYEWYVVTKDKEDELYVYMSDEPDPRDWIIEDYIEEGTLHLTISMAFTAIYNSLKRN